MCKAKDTTSFNKTQANNRGGYAARSQSNPFFLTRGGARQQYVAAQALKKSHSPTEEQNATRGANNGSERGQGSRGRGRGPRRNYSTK